jgi:hypothetical protein
MKNTLLFEEFINLNEYTGDYKYDPNYNRNNPKPTKKDLTEFSFDYGHSTKDIKYIQKILDKAKIKAKVQPAEENPAYDRRGLTVVSPNDNVRIDAIRELERAGFDI